MGDEGAFGGGFSGELGYRPKSLGGKRQPRGLLRYTDDEWAVIVQVAVLVGMRPGAWAQQAAYDAKYKK